MISDRLDLQKMVAITDAVFTKEQEKMNALLLREAHIRNLLREISEQASSKCEDTSPDLVNSALVRAKWLAWSETTKIGLNRELARVLALKDAQKTPLSAAFGKQQAMIELLRTLQSQRNQSAVRRESYMS